LSSEVTEAYDKLKDSIDAYLYKSEFFIINLGEMFNIDKFKRKLEFNLHLENAFDSI